MTEEQATTIQFKYDGLEIKLYLDTDEQVHQLKLYLLTYTPADLGTIFNLITWAKARNMRVETKVKGWFSLNSLALRFLLYAYRTSAEARRVFAPQRYTR